VLLYIRDRMTLYYTRAAICGIGMRRIHISSCDLNRSHYEVLGVPRTATQKEIKEAYFELSKKFHPDMDTSKSSLEEMVMVNAAYSILSKPIERRDYDRRLGFDRYTTTYTEDGHARGRTYDRPATFDERRQQYGFRDPDPNYWKKSGDTRYKVLWGCIAWIVIGGTANFLFAKLLRRWETDQYQNKIAKMKEEDEAHRKYAERFGSRMEFQQEMVRLNALHSQERRRRRAPFFGSGADESDPEELSPRSTSTVSR